MWVLAPILLGLLRPIRGKQAAGSQALLRAEGTQDAGVAFDASGVGHLLPKRHHATHAAEPASLPHTRRHADTESVRHTVDSTKRHGELKPPAPARNTQVDHAALSKVHLWEGGHQQKRQRQRPFQHRHARKADNRWTFRGPKPFPILGDSRLTKEEKKHELERIIEKLHVEFFQKKQMGHSRLAQAHATFHKALADYRQLTGLKHPPKFNYKELPHVPRGVAELQQDDHSEVEHEAEEESQDESMAVKDDLPPCMDACQATQECDATDANTWSNAKACKCYTEFQDCALAECSHLQRDQDATLLAIDKSASEVCDFATPDSKVWQHLHMSELTQRPTGDHSTVEGMQSSADARSTGTSGHVEVDADSLFQQWRASHKDLRLSPLLEDNEAASLQEGAPPGQSNAPSKKCLVSHPEMLGDGNCDGGTYNTAACNYDGGDCCSSDCRPAQHTCGVAGYMCKGDREGVRVDKAFKCGNTASFKEYFDELRDKITLGESMLAKGKCTQLVKEEHNNVAQSFNIGVTLGFHAAIKSAAAVVGGPGLFLDCDLFKEVGSNWFGALVTHELGHSAGYSHPEFEDNKYMSECRNIGDAYCPGHCQEWTDACENHFIFGSEMCGVIGAGCQTQCVHSDYCDSLPERLTECLGYQKVHSRGEGGDTVSRNKEWVEGGATMAVPYMSRAWNCAKCMFGALCTCAPNGEEPVPSERAK